MNEIINLGNGAFVKIMMLKGRQGDNIATIVKTGTSGLVDTYTITLTDGSTHTFEVTNGNGIVSIQRTATEGLVDTYTITYQNGQTSTFTVTNSNVDGVNQNIAPTETTATSVNDYDIGAMLINTEGKLCEVIDTIKAGDTLTIGSNIKYSDVASAVGDRLSGATYLAQTPTYDGKVLLHKMFGMSQQDGTPTPSSPVAIKSAKANFRNCGKNLIPFPYSGYAIWSSGGYTFSNGSKDGVLKIDSRAGYSGNGTSYLTGRPNEAYGIKFEPNVRYKLSVKRIRGTTSASMGIVTLTWYRKSDESYQGHKVQIDIPTTLNTVASSTFTITPEQAESYFLQTQVIVVSGQTLSNEEIEVSVTLADTDNDYEVYNGQDVNTNLTLRAIEVTSTDAYNLVKDGKYYIADTLEYKDGGYQITRRIGELGLDGTVTINAWALGTTSTTFGFRSNIAYGSSDNYDNKKCLCNRFLDDSVAGTSALNSVLAQTVPTSGGIGFYFKLDNTIANSLVDAQTWLSSNNVIVYYPLHTPTVETITPEQALSLLSLKSYDEATYIAQTEDAEGKMMVEYGKTQLATRIVTGFCEYESLRNAITVDGEKLNTIDFELSGTTLTITTT